MSRGGALPKRRSGWIRTLLVVGLSLVFLAPATPAQAAVADLDLQLSGPTTAAWDSTNSFTWTVSNHGPDPADGGTINFSVTGGAIIDASSITCTDVSAGATCPDFTALSSSQLRGDLGAAPAGANWVITADVIMPASGSSISVQGQVAPPAGTDDNSGTNSRSWSVSLSAADVRITKTPSTTEPAAGEPYTWTVEYANVSAVEATDVRLWDEISAVGLLTSWTEPVCVATGGASCPGGFGSGVTGEDIFGTVFDATVPSMPANSTVTLTYEANHYADPAFPTPCGWTYTMENQAYAVSPNMTVRSSWQGLGVTPYTDSASTTAVDRSAGTEAGAPMVVSSTFYAPCIPTIMTVDYSWTLPDEAAFVVADPLAALQCTPPTGNSCPSFSYDSNTRTFSASFFWPDERPYELSVAGTVGTATSGMFSTTSRATSSSDMDPSNNESTTTFAGVNPTWAMMVAYTVAADSEPISQDLTLSGTLACQDQPDQIWSVDLAAGSASADTFAGLAIQGLGCTYTPDSLPSAPAGYSWLLTPATVQIDPVPGEYTADFTLKLVADSAPPVGPTATDASGHSMGDPVTLEPLVAVGSSALTAATFTDGTTTATIPAGSWRISLTNGVVQGVFTPAPGFLGTTSIDYRVTDANDLTSTARLTATVDPIPLWPLSVAYTVAADSEAITTDLALTGTLRCDDQAASPWSVNLPAGAPSAQASVGLGTQGVGCSFTPDPLPAAPYGYAWLLSPTSDSVNPVTEAYTANLTVKLVSDAAPPVGPSASDASGSSTGTPITLRPAVALGSSALASASFADGSTSLSVDGEGVWTISLVNGVVEAAFTPTPDFVGDSTVDYRVTDANDLTSTARLTATVTAVPTWPLSVSYSVAADSAPIPRDVTFAGTLSCDGQAARTWSATLVAGESTVQTEVGTAPEGAECTFLPSQPSMSPAAYSWLLSPSAATVQVAGAYTADFTVKLIDDAAPITGPIASDAHGSSTGAPVVLHPEVALGSSALAEVSSAAGEATTVIEGEGSWTISLTNGVVEAVFTPEAGFLGTSWLNYLVTDANGLSDSAELSAEITADPIDEADDPLAFTGAQVGPWLGLGLALLAVGATLLVARRRRA